MLSTSNHNYPAMHQSATTSTAGIPTTLLAGLLLAWNACTPDTPERPADAGEHIPAAGSQSSNDDDSPADSGPGGSTLLADAGPPPTLDLETALTIVAGPL